MQDTSPSVERAPRLGRNEKQPIQRAGLNMLLVAKPINDVPEHDILVVSYYPNLLQCLAIHMHQLQLHFRCYFP